jgi:hypothetical protein
MFTGLEKVAQPNGVSVTVNLTDWKQVAHSLRILANTLESIEYPFAVGSVGRVEAPDGASCGGWVVTEGKVW